MLRYLYHSKFKQHLVSRHHRPDYLKPGKGVGYDCSCGKKWSG